MRTIGWAKVISDDGSWIRSDLKPILAGHMYVPSIFIVNNIIIVITFFIVNSENFQKVAVVGTQRQVFLRNKSELQVILKPSRIQLGVAGK